MKTDRPHKGMSMIVRTVARWLRGLILLYGIYVVLYGHITPGGGFAGGVVIACGFILLTLAYGEQDFFAKSAAAKLDSLGILGFLTLAWLGTWWAGGHFFANFIPTPEAAWFTLPSAGIIPLSNMGLGLKVASSIFLVFAVLAAFRVTGRDDGQDQGEDGP